MHTKMQEREGGGWKATLTAGVVPAGGCKSGLPSTQWVLLCVTAQRLGLQRARLLCSKSALHCLVSFQKLYWRKKRGKKRLFILV